MVKFCKDLTETAIRKARLLSVTEKLILGYVILLELSVPFHETRWEDPVLCPVKPLR